MSDVAADAKLKRTPLYRLHLDLGARMVPFAEYDMPVQYPSGILKEHLHVRAAAMTPLITAPARHERTAAHAAPKTQTWQR